MSHHKMFQNLRKIYPITKLAQFQNFSNSKCLIPSCPKLKMSLSEALKTMNSIGVKINLVVGPLYFVVNSSNLSWAIDQ